jgi:hypothetical protein
LVCGATEQNLTLAQVATDVKSNEITAIPRVLELVDIKGATITIDAMGCQKAIAKQIVDSEPDYILAVKGNQPTLEGCDLLSPRNDGRFCWSESRKERGALCVWSW